MANVGSGVADGTVGSYNWLVIVRAVIVCFGFFVMAGRVEVIEHTADVALRVYGSDLTSLFEAALGGLYELIGEIVVGDEAERYTIRLEAGNVDDLFHDWLAEGLYWFEVRQIVFEEVKFGSLGERSLTAEVVGRKVDIEKSQLHSEVKAVTYHDLAIRRENEELVVTVVFDL